MRNILSVMNDTLIIHKTHIITRFLFRLLTELCVYYIVINILCVIEWIVLLDIVQNAC